MTAKSFEYYTSLIRGLDRAHDFERGKALIEAKADLTKRGEFGRMLADVGMHKREAQRLMQLAKNLARNPKFAKATNSSLSRAAARVLGRLPADKFDELVATGQIINMTEKQAKTYLVPVQLTEGTLEIPTPHSTPKQETQTYQPPSAQIKLLDGLGEDFTAIEKKMTRLAVLGLADAVAEMNPVERQLLKTKVDVAAASMALLLQALNKRRPVSRADQNDEDKVVLLHG